MSQRFRQSFSKLLRLRKAIIVVGSLFVLLAVQLPIATPVGAAAPAGTMTGTNMIMQGSETKAINAITITDAGGEITTAGDIAIHIPSTMANTVWDTSDGTATITGSASGKVSAAVQFYNYGHANDTIGINVLSNFTAGESITVSGLSMITSGQGTVASTDLEWAVDGGVSPPAITWSSSSGIELEIDTTAPVVSGIAYTPSTGSRMVGEAVSVLITADDVGYTESAITVNNQAVTGFTDNANNTYSVTYTVAEGHTDRAAGALPASVVLSDAAGNTNSAYTTVAANTLSVDANTPVVSGIAYTPSTGSTKVGDTVSVLITADGTGYTSGGITVNSQAVTGFTDNANNTYTVTYTVAEGNTDRAAGALPASVVLSDPAGNSNTAYTAVTANTLSVDANSPTITDLYYEDNGNDGSVDRLIVEFSENCTWTGNELNQFMINNQNLAGFDSDNNPDSFAGGSGTDTFTLTTSGTTNLTGVSGLTEPTTDYAQAAPPNQADRIKDAAGNDLMTMAPSSIRDEAYPVLTSFTSTEADDIYGPTDTINVTANYTENISSGSVAVALNTTGTATLSTASTTTLSGNYTVGATGSGENTTDLTVSSISSQSAADSAANANSSTTMPSTNIADGSDIEVDTTAPTPTVTIDSNPIYEGDLTQQVTITYDEMMDNGTTPTVVFTGGNWGAPAAVGWSTTTLTDDTYTVNFTHTGAPDNIAAETATVGAVSGATDEAGNADTADSSPGFGVDTVDPVPTITSAPAPTNGTQTITFTATDTGGSGVNTTTCSVNGTTFAPCTSGDTYSSLSNWGPLADGPFTLTLRVTDNAGNTDDDTSASTKDTVSPTPSASVDTVPIYEGDLTQQVTIQYDESMNPGSTPSVAFNSGNWGAPAGGGWGTTVFPNDTYTVTYTHSGAPENLFPDTATVGAVSGATDEADNADNVDASPPTFGIDTIDPVPTITVATSPTNGTQTIAFTATDTGGTGVNSTECSVNGTTFAPCTSGDAYSSLSNWGPLAEGPFTLTLRVTDNAGNTADDTAASTKDTAAPVLQSFTSSTGDATYGPTATVNVTATYDENLDAGSSMSVVLDNGVTVGLTNIAGATLSGTYTVGATGSGEDSADLTVASISAEGALDFAGNTQSASAVPAPPNNIADTSAIVVDTTAPTFGSAVANSDTNVLITMNEPVSSVTFGAAADWTATGMVSTGAVLNGSDIDLTVASLSNTGFTAADFAFAIANGGDIQDAVGNSAAAFGPVGITDGQAPLFDSSVVDDTDHNGTVDQATITYSETVVITDGNVGDGFPGITFADNCVAANADYASAGTTTSVVVLTGCDPGAITADPTYTAAAGQIEDLATNEMPNAETVVGTDISKPVATSVTFYDQDGSNDGKLDLITVVWSKTLTAVADGSADWTLTSAADFAGIVEGTVECNSGAAGATECDYNFTTTTEKTDVGDLTLAYAGTSVTDGTNAADPATYTSASTPAFSDGASPVVKSTTITLYDVAGADAIADRLIATYTEPLADNADSVGDWTVITNSHDSGGSCIVTAADPDGTDTLIIDMTCDTPYGDVGDMSAAFVQSGDTLEDSAGNDAPSKTYTSASTPPIVNGIVPGVLTATNVQPASLNMGTTGTATVSFTTVKPIGIDGKIKVTFGTNYDVTGAAAGDCSSMDGTFVTTVAGQEVTLTRQSDGTSTAPAAQTCTIGTVKNPPAAGSTGTYDITTTYTDDVVIDQDTAVAADTIVDPTPAPGGGGGSGGGRRVEVETTTPADPNIDETITEDTTYDEPIQVGEDMIETDEETGEQSAQLTGEGAEVVLENTEDPSVSVTVPENTTVTGDEDWDGSINPPVIQAETVIDEAGEPIEGLDDDLTRDNVDAVVMIESTNELTFSNPVSIEIATDLPEGTVVRILFSEDGDNWEDFGVAVVKNGVITFTTTHFSYFAISAELAGDEIPVPELIDEDGEEGLYFDDIAGHWAEDYINQMAELEIVNGKSERIFAPNDDVTRAELTKIAVNAFGIILPTEAVTEKSFDDVEIAEWYAPYIQVAKQNSIVEGYGDDFRPNASINRAEALKILLEASNLDISGEFDVSFDDTIATAWYMPYVGYAASNSIVSGYGDGTFGPEKNMTRAEVSKVIVLIMDMM